LWSDVVSPLLSPKVLFWTCLRPTQLMAHERLWSHRKQRHWSTSRLYCTYQKNTQVPFLCIENIKSQTNCVFPCFGRSKLTPFFTSFYLLHRLVFLHETTCYLTFYSQKSRNHHTLNIKIIQCAHLVLLVKIKSFFPVRNSVESSFLREKWVTNSQPRTATTRRDRSWCAGLSLP
jgi:hypothetical protein